MAIACFSTCSRTSFPAGGTRVRSARRGSSSSAAVATLRTSRPVVVPRFCGAAISSGSASEDSAKWKRVGCQPIMPACKSSGSPRAGVIANAAASEGGPSIAAEYLQKFTGLGLLLAADKALKMVFAQAGWSFPAPLAGMFMIMAVLAALDAASPKVRGSVEAFFAPALNWIARWLPLFYVPSLVMLPIILQQVPSAALAKVVGIVVVGMVMSLIVTAQVAVTVRNIVKTEMADSGPPSPALPGPNKYHRIGWAAAALASLATVTVSPGSAPIMAVPFLLSGTVGGYLIGMALPAGVKKILHPIVTTCLVGIASAAFWGAFTGTGMEAALMTYKTPAATGAGDILMSFLGIVILSFGFRVYAQRDLMVRHRYEILGCTLASALFSLVSTVLMARAVSLDPLLACAIAPRAVTVALALPIAQQLQAASLAGVTAAAVCFEGLIGASFCQPLLDKLGFKDPIVRGMSTAGAAHGLGTASLAANEPDALPFCALAYAIIGILATLLSCIPFVRTGLMAMAGMPIAV